MFSCCYCYFVDDIQLGTMIITYVSSILEIPSHSNSVGFICSLDICLAGFSIEKPTLCVKSKSYIPSRCEHVEKNNGLVLL